MRSCVHALLREGCGAGACVVDGGQDGQDGDDPVQGEVGGVRQVGVDPGAVVLAGNCAAISHGQTASTMAKQLHVTGFIIAIQARRKRRASANKLS